MKKIVIAALIISLFLMSTSISFVAAAELKQAGKYTFQAKGYTIEYILPCDADFYAEKDSYGPLEWGALAFGWDLFRVFFDDAKEREVGALTVYHLNKSYWQEWQERIYWKQVSTFKDFDEFFEFIQEILFWMEARRTTASGHEVIILEGDYGEKIFWVQVDDDNIFVIDAERAICSSPYPPVYCPDPKLFWEIVDEFVQSFKVTAIEQPHTYYVNPGESIQDAVDTASDGDTIIVYPGTYTENVNVNKRLTIKSENGAEATIVQAAHSDDHVFMVKAGFVNISGFTVKGATGNRRAGIYIDAYHCTISNNTASNNCCGILLYSTSNNTVTNNNASNNHNCGIELFSSGNNIIANNNANWNSDHPHGGICLRVSSNNNTVMNNNALNNSCGIHLADSSNNNIMNNNLSDGFYLYSSSNNIVYLNNFINNTWRNVDSYKSTNIWNSPSKITYTYNGNTFTSYLGNYWDDYKDKYPGAKDKDNTGIWNTPYEIDGDNDYYPLVEWVENYFPGQEVPELCTIPDPPSHDFGEVPEGVQKSWRFNIVNSGSGTLEWEVSVNNPWISVNPSSGYTTTEQDPVEVTIDTSGLSGCNQGTLLITSNGGAKQGTIEVVVEVIRIVDNDRRLLKPNTKADPEYKYPEYAEVSIYTETVSEDELNIYVELNTINECVDKDTNETLLVDFGHGFEKGAITVLADEEATVLWDEAKLMVKGELKSQDDWPWNGAKTLGEVAYSGAPCKLMKAKKTIDPLVGVIYKGGGIVPAFYYKYIGEMPYTEWKPSYKWGSIVGGELGRKLLIEKLPVLGDLTSIEKILKGWAEEDAFARLLEQDPQEIFVPNYDEVTRSWAGIMAPDQWHICRFNSVVLIVPIKIKPDKTHSVAVRGKAYPYVFSGGKFLTFAKHFEVNPGKPLAQLTTAGEPYIAPGFAGDNIMLDESVMHKNNTRMKFTVFARSPEADPFTKYIFVEVSQFPEYGGIGPHFAEIKGGFASITVEETAQVPEDKIITDHLLDVWTYMTYDPPIAYENYNSKTYEAIPVIEEASAWEAVEFITTKLIALKCPQVAELIGLVFTVDDIIKYLDDCTTDFKVMRINEAEMDTFTDIWAGKERIIGTSEKYASVVTVFPIRFCSSVGNTIAVRSGVIVGSHEFLYSKVLEIPNGTKEVTCPCVADSWMMPSYPTVNNGQSRELWVLDNGVNTALGLVSFDLSAIPEDAVIHNAMVELYDHKYTKFKEDVVVYRILEQWEEMTVCYNNHPRFASSPEGHVGPEPAGWISWDITPLTKQWAAGILPNYGLVLKASLGTDRVFYSREAKEVEQRPRLKVEYSLSPKTIYVDDDFVVDDPANHKWNTIQEGIKDANDGDTILVYPGTYAENVEITKSLTIKSTSGNPEDTIVQAKSSDSTTAGNVFTVTADNAHIDGFTIKGASYSWCSGILIGGSHCIISNNTFEENAIGIWTHPPSGTDNTIRNTNFSSSSESDPSTALYLEATGNKIYLSNFISGMECGQGNIWNSLSPIAYIYNGNTFTSYLGNYWDDYQDKYPGAKEKDNTGIWDTPYSIDGDKDNYPLMEPWENYFPKEEPWIEIEDIFPKRILDELKSPVPIVLAGEETLVSITFRNNGDVALENAAYYWDGGALAIDNKDLVAGGSRTFNMWIDATGYGSGQSITKTFKVTGMSQDNYYSSGEDLRVSFLVVSELKQSERYLDLAAHWAPVWYQDTATAMPSPLDLEEMGDLQGTYRGDYIANFDYDGSWKGIDNWDNLGVKNSEGYKYPLNCQFYYWVVETEINWFIGYAKFHPRDWKRIPTRWHENDMEGCLLVIKKDGSAYGKFLGMLTVAHLWINSYEVADVISVYDEYGGQHPCVYVEARGHGVYGDPDRDKCWDDDKGNFKGGDGVIYRYTGTAEEPEAGKLDETCYSVGYALRSINELWDMRYDCGNEHPFAKFGVFRGDDGKGDAANAPWSWDAKVDGEVYEGDPFMDPAYLVWYYQKVQGEFPNTDLGEEEPFHTYISRSYPVIVESFHPYKDNYHRVWSWRVPHAKEVKIRFKEITLAPPIDFDDHGSYICIYNATSDKPLAEIDGGSYLDQWFGVEGDTIRIELTTGKATSWGFCADRCEPVMPPIWVEGGSPYYKPLEVFFRGSSIHVNLANADVGEHTFDLQLWEDSPGALNLKVEEGDQWHNIDYKVKAGAEVDLELPANCPIGLYRLQVDIGGNKYTSNNFYIIFDPEKSGIGPDEKSKYFDSEDTGDRNDFSKKLNLVHTNYHSEPVMTAMAAAATSGLEIYTSREDTQKAIGNWVCEVMDSEVPSDPPNNVCDYIDIIRSGEKLKGDCDCYTVLLIALARASGTPAREIIGVGVEKDSNDNWVHTWTEIYINDWKVFDPFHSDWEWGTNYPGYMESQKNYGYLGELEAVWEELGSELTNKYKPSKKLVATLKCLANLHAYDSQGNHVGVNTKGKIDLQIPNSYYTGPDYEPEEIIIFGQTENIKFKVDALDEGKFNLTITQSTEAGTTEIIYNDVPIAETTEATVDVSEANPTYIMEIDTNGDGTTDRKREPEPIDGNDTVPPELTILSPEDGQIYRMREIPLEVSANEPVSKWSYNLNSAAPVTFTPNTWITAREGDNSLVVYAEDLAGNVGSSVVSFVVDTTPPVIICPADVTVELETLEGTVVPLEATATDNCDPNPVLTSNELDIYPPGTTIMTFTATDASGNSASCSTNVAVYGPKEIEQRIWPSEAPVDTCKDGAGNPHSTTGEDSADWFLYGGAGDWKIFDVTPGTRIHIHSRGDSCPGCVLWHINYYLDDYYGGAWHEVTFIDGPDQKGAEHDYYYVPIGDRVRIRATSGFYVAVYGLKFSDGEKIVPSSN